MTRSNVVTASGQDRVSPAGDVAAQRVFEFSDDLLGSASREGYFTSLNPAWERTLGFPRATLMAQPFIEFVHPADRDATTAEMERLAAEGVGGEHFQNRFAIREGGWRWLQWKVAVYADGYCFVAHDITLQLAASQRTHLLSHVVEGVDDAIMTKTTDGVVTSWNRASEELYGYCAAEAIGKHVDDLIVPVDLRGEPKQIIDRLLAGEGVRQYTTQRHDKEGEVMTVSLTASLLRDDHQAVVGAAVVSRDLAELDHHVDGSREELDTLAWVGRIRDAIDEQRVVFFAQPIVGLGSAVGSHELLCRIMDRDGEIVPPARFLPAAENYGLVSELDLLAVDEGVRLIAEGHHINLNLSTVSVARRHIVDVIGDRLRAAGADPSKLTLEITETALMKGLVAAQRFAALASELGCRIALDDFGTGFGGFTYLKRMQIDQLKIDVEFVRDLTSSRASQHVVRAVVSLAEGLGLETVAEGVEDAETLALLEGYGVTHVQGFHLARPGPIAEVIG